MHKLESCAGVLVQVTDNADNVDTLRAQMVPDGCLALVCCAGSLIWGVRRSQRAACRMQVLPRIPRSDDICCRDYNFRYCDAANHTHAIEPLATSVL